MVVAVLRAAGVALWAALVLIPLVVLGAQVSAGDLKEGLSLWVTPAGLTPTAATSLGLAALVAVLAVLLGLVPAYLMATGSRRARGLLMTLALAGVLLPQYVLYYTWAVCLGPTATIGQYVAQDRTLAEWAAWISSTLTLVLWYWPLAALLLAQGWRSIPAELREAAALDARPLARVRYITAPLLARPAALALALCFTLCLADFAALHLATRVTIGTQLALLLQESLRVGPAVAGSLPLVALSLAVAVWLQRSAGSWSAHTPTTDAAPYASRQTLRWAWALTIALLLLTLAMPLALLLSDLSPHALWLFVTLQSEKYAQSAAVSAFAATLAIALAAGAARSSAGFRSHSRESNGAFGLRLLRALIAISLLTVALVPGGLVGIAMSQFISQYSWLLPLRDSVLLVSLFQGVRFAGIALIVLWAVRDARSHVLTEAAATDGASPWQTWWHVHRPLAWPTLLGAGILVTLLGLTEVSGSQLVAPPGSFSLSLFLLNQMHALRDQQVVAACLLLVGFYIAAAGGLWLVLRVARLRRSLGVLLVAACVGSLALGGCSQPKPGQADVRGKIGRSGTGQVEFLYPRAIDRFGDGTLVILDKSGRIQLIRPDGQFERAIQLTEITNGKPTGVSVGPDGNIYVADTHCHRVMVLSRQGELVRQWGSFGQGDGQFIYPTDIAFLPDGRVLVSEYGQHDRISIFTPEGKFLGCFGSYGSESGQLSRPQAMAVDASRGRLYVTDACNHRIAMYNLSGELQGYIGSPGSELGQLRYPYGLALTRDGRLVVVEQGNNRVQLFSPEGKALATYGTPGRELGQLSYPWSVTIDDANVAYVVDGGNDRVQAWQLPNSE